MRTLLAIAAASALLFVLAPVASADPTFVDIVGPHPDANGGATCMDAIEGSAHQGLCEGAWSCPLYYDLYNGISGCEYTPTVNLSFVPFFEIVGPHGDANPTGAKCSDVLADGSHIGVCAGSLSCPVYIDDYAGLATCLL